MRKNVNAGRKISCLLLVTWLSITFFGCHDSSSEKSSTPKKLAESSQPKPENDKHIDNIVDSNGRPVRGFDLQGEDLTKSEVLDTAYGELCENDFDHLYAFAKENGYDLQEDLKYQSNDKDSKEALVRVFQFSMTFKKMDKNTRCYGQIIFNSLLNFGEIWSVPTYADILNHQKPEVTQRIRDFLFYPMETAPGEEKQAGEEAKKYSRERYPMLFPKDYVFGKDDSLFKEFISPPP